MVSIMPGMENFAPERTETSSGFSPAPSFWPCSFSSRARAACISSSICGTDLAAHVLAAGFGLNGESRRNGQTGVGHLCKTGAFAAKDVLHVAVAVGFAAAEEVDIWGRASTFCSLPSAWEATRGVVLMLILSVLPPLRALFLKSGISALRWAKWRGESAEHDRRPQSEIEVIVDPGDGTVCAPGHKQM